MRIRTALLFLGMILLWTYPVQAKTTWSSRIDSLKNQLNQSNLDARTRINILNSLVKSYWKVQPDSSLHFGKEAMSLEQQIIDDSLKAEILGNIGVAYYYSNSFESSLEYLYKALEIWEKQEDKSKMANILNGIGNVYYSLNNKDEALEYYTRSLSLLEKTGNRKMVASTLINMGSLYNSLGQNTKAHDVLVRSIEILEQIKDSIGLSSALNNLGLVYKEQKDFSKALSCNLRALEISFRLNSDWEIAYISNAIGEIYLLLKNYDKAGRYLNQGLSFARKISTADVLLYSYRSLTYYYSAIGNNEEFTRCFKEYDALKDSIFKTENTRSIAEMQVKYETAKKDKENAIQKLQLAKEKDLRNSLIFISILILILGGVLYSRYRVKRRLNLELEAKVEQRTADLLKNQVKLKEAQRIGKSGSWDWDLVKGRFDWSDELNTVLGVPPDRKLNIRYLLTSVHVDDMEPIRNALKRKFGKQHELVFDFRFDTPDKNRKYLSLHGEISFDASLKPIYVQGTIQDITDRKLMEQRILSNTIETEERERTRFSEDLHDGLGPLLSTVKIHLEMISNRMEKAVEQEKYIRMAGELLDESIRSTREIANNLTPNILNDFGLIEALSVYVNKINKTGTVRIDLFVGEDMKRPAQHVEVAFYRILCELINNTIKHASASQIIIRFTMAEQGILIDYSDNGIGFDVQNILNSRSKGLGLSNIISRLKSINASYSFRSELGKNFEAFFAASLSGEFDPYLNKLLS